MQPATSILLCGLSAALLLGCGSGGYAPANLQSAATPPAVPTAPAPSAPAPSAPAPSAPPGPPDATVTMRALAFSPSTVTTVVGRGVQWVNRDDVRHNVTSLDGATIASPDLPPGGHFVYLPARPGRLRYLCTIHPSTMSGVLIIRPRP